jgi:hypothetical protein
MKFGIKFGPLTELHVIPPAQKGCRSLGEGSNLVESLPEAGTNPCVVDWDPPSTHLGTKADMLLFIPK